MAGFDTNIFLRQLGEKLVWEFGHGGLAGTPGLIGSAREHPAQRQLQALLPTGSKVGSGIVFDSYGGVSSQQDIVIYDATFTPVFSVNDTSESTYFPVEGVIAVGEVKSTLGSSEIKDSFLKIGSVKKLRRHVVREEGASLYRSYGSAMAFHGAEEEYFEQDAKATDQVLGFVLCGKFSSSVEATLTNIIKCSDLDELHLIPTVFSSLGDGYVLPLDQAERKNPIFRKFCRLVVFRASKMDAFPALMRRIEWVTRHGRTVPIEAFDRYWGSTLIEPQPEDRIVTL